MKPSQSDIEFYQKRFPALLDSNWEWSDFQSVLSSRATRELENISYSGVNEKRFASVSISFFSTEEFSLLWGNLFRVTIRNTEYPPFVHGDRVDIDIYKATSKELFDAATDQAKSLLESNLQTILEAEREWIVELQKRGLEDFD